MKITEVRALAIPEIESKLEDTREELFHLRFQFKTGELTDYSRLKDARRTVARLETILRERQLAAQLAAEEK